MKGGLLPRHGTHLDKVAPKRHLLVPSAVNIASVTGYMSAVRVEAVRKEESVRVIPRCRRKSSEAVNADSDTSSGRQRNGEYWLQDGVSLCFAGLALEPPP